MHIYIHVVKELTILSLKYLIECCEYVKQNIILKYYHKINNTLHNILCYQ